MGDDVNILLDVKMQDIDKLESQIRGDINKLSKRVNLDISKVEIKDIDKSISRIQNQLNQISKSVSLNINKVNIKGLDDINAQLKKQLKNSNIDGNINVKNTSNLKIVKGEFEDIRQAAMKSKTEIQKLNGEMAKMSVKTDSSGNLKSVTLTSQYDKARQSVEQYGYVAKQQNGEVVKTFELIGKTLVDNKAKAENTMASQEKYLNELILKTNQYKNLSIQEGRRNENYNNTGHLNQIAEIQNRINGLKNKSVELTKSEKNELDILVKKIGDKVKEESGYAKEVNKSTQFLQSQIKVLNNAKLRAENRGSGDKTKQSEIISAINKQIQQYQELINKNKVLGNVEQNRIRNAVGGIKNQTQELTRFESEFKNIFGRMKDYMVSGQILYSSLNYAKQGIRDLIAINDSMISLRKVSSEVSNQQLQQYQEQANITAKDISAKTEDIIESASAFKQAGFNFDESKELAKNSAIYQNIGDMSAEESYRGLISTMKAYNLESSQTIDIMDKINNVSNHTSTSASGLNSALMRSSSALAVANNNLGQSISLISTSNTAIQDPARVGNGLKTISMNLNTMKQTANGLVPKFESLFQTITNGQVSLLDNNGKMKSTFDVVKDLSEVWDDLSAKQKNLLGQKIAGNLCPSV